MITTLARTIRTLRRSPVFVVVATLSLGIGLGLSTATFAMVDAILHPRLIFAEVDQLYYARLRWGNQRNPPSIREQMRALRELPGVAAVELMSMGMEQGGIITVDRAAQRAQATRMTSGLFDALGVRPHLGRLPNSEEVRTQRAVVVSQHLWHSAFRSAPDTRGAVLTVGDQVYSVVGVLPRGAELRFQFDVWIPFASETETERIRASSATMLVKLRPGVSRSAIEPQLATVAGRFTAAYSTPAAPPYVLELKTIRPQNRSIQEFELLMLGIAFGVLAIACTNVAALSLARGLTRRRDYALRFALGASRFSIAGEVLAEVSAIAALGTAFGVLVAIALNGMFTRIVPEDLTWRWLSPPALDARVFAYAVFAFVIATLASGGIPAWRASRLSPSDPLKDNAGTTTGKSRAEFRVLVMGELAITMVLLMLASLMTLSTKNIRFYDFGYDAHRLLRASVSVWRPKDTLSTAAREQAQRNVLARIIAHPEVAGVAMVGGGATDDRTIMSDETRRGVPPLEARGYFEVGPAFFATLGIPVEEGRDFAEGDQLSDGTIILSRGAAKVLFPSGGAVGRLVKLGGLRSSRAWMPVVGIVRDVDLDMRADPMSEPEPRVYASSPRGRGDTWFSFAIRRSREDPALAVSLQHALSDALPPRSYVRVGSWLENHDSRLQFQLFFERVFTFIGTASLLLGAAGLFSVLSYAVGQRMREFAVRSALGASPRDLLRIVLKSGFEMALGGTAIGALLSFWASAGVSGFLYGVKNTDPVSLVIAEATLLAVTMLASLVPALRAMRADPVEVLRAT